MNYFYGSLAIFLILIGVEQYGEHRIQTEWNLETARLEAIAKQERALDKIAFDAANAQHRKDIENAKSEAGKSAIRDYLRTHGVLYSEGNSGQATNTSTPDESASKCGTSDRVEEFAGRCAQDALTIFEWQEWAMRENLEVE